MMMNSPCIAGCLDAQTPVKVSFVKLYQWAQADKEFLRMLSKKKETESSISSSASISSNSPIPSPVTVRRHSTSTSCYEYYRSYVSSRQRYLRSYTFSARKESVSQRTKKWLKEKKKKKKCNIDNSKDRTADADSGSCSSFTDAVFKLLFACVAKVDVYEF